MRTYRLTTPLACFLLAAGSAAPLPAQISLTITIGPPPIPIYEQPLLPDEGYAWTPGYWAWGEEGYFWVPGTWVEVPRVGLLWTPGYWGWSGDSFVFYTGYWDTHVGFYGGINYGYGYGGYGFEGGYWEGQRYYYNRAVANVNITHVTNVYTRTVVVHNETRVAYNGGSGGLQAAPTPQEQAVKGERHVPPTAVQAQHRQLASQNRELLASVNRGKPAVAATVKPADFSPRSVVPAKAPGGHVEEAALQATPKTSGRPAPGPTPKAPPAGPEGREPRVPPAAHGEHPRIAPAPEPPPRPVPDPPRPNPAPRPEPPRRTEPTPEPSRKPQPPRPAEPAPPSRREPAPPSAGPEQKPAPHPEGRPDRKGEPPREKKGEGPRDKKDEP